MKQNRKATAWRKNRKFCEVHGGRKHPKIPDKIFNRCHSLKRPGPGEKIPILIEDNPSRDFFFPISGEEALKALSRLPSRDTAGITHVWLRRIKKRDFEERNLPFAWYICGSGVHLIVLHPWPQDMILRFGRTKPTKKQFNAYAKFTTDWYKEKRQWYLRWTQEAIRRFYIEELLFHEVGHHVDFFLRRWSKANQRQREEFADQYAVYWSQRNTKVIERFAKQESF